MNFYIWYFYITYDVIGSRVSVKLYSWVDLYTKFIVWGIHQPALLRQKCYHHSYKYLAVWIENKRKNLPTNYPRVIFLAYHSNFRILNINLKRAIKHLSSILQLYNFGWYLQLKTSFSITNTSIATFKKQHKLLQNFVILHLRHIKQS